MYFYQSITFAVGWDILTAFQRTPNISFAKEKRLLKFSGKQMIKKEMTLFSKRWQHLSDC